MLNWIKKQSIAVWLVLAAAVFAIVAVIIYSINSTTGVMQTIELDVAPIVYSVIAIVLLAGIIAANGKVPQWVISAAMVVIVVFLTLSLCGLIENRTDIAGDQWFIPGLDTPEKGACLSQAIVGVVFYALSIIALVVSAFMGKFERNTAKA